jgi:nucleotide-binding universal stress UspA family protein
MKPILVPTDFSKCSYNAVNFAIQIAKETNTKIILIHVYQNPIPATDLPMMEFSKEEPLIAAQEQLKKMVDFELLVNNDIKELDIKYEAIEGLTINEIITSAKTHDAGLIVIGTQGASNLMDTIMGSNTANLIAKSTVPVLAVPQSAKYLGIHKIVLPTDFHAIKDRSTFDDLLEIVLRFNSKIFILTILKGESNMPTLEQISEFIELKNYFGRIPYSIHTDVSDDIPEAIEKFAKEILADLIVLIPQKHNFLQLLFNKSLTRKLVLHTHTPILSLPDII